MEGERLVREEGGSEQEEGEGILLAGLRGALVYLQAHLVPGRADFSQWFLQDPGGLAYSQGCQLNHFLG